MSIKENLTDLYVFVAKTTRARAVELVACYDSDAEVEKAVAVYKAPFSTRHTACDEAIEFVGVN